MLVVCCWFEHALCLQLFFFKSSVTFCRISLGARGANTTITTNTVLAENILQSKLCMLLVDV